MTSKSESYPAVYIIFTLLNAFRRGIKRKNIWREFRRQKTVLKPRLGFWIAVCKEAGLLKADEEELKVTGYALRWLKKTPEEQTFHLIDSWQNAPKNKKIRQFRKKLLWKLKYDKPLTVKDMSAINGLEAFGLVREGLLTRWGTFLIKGEGKLLTPKPVESCEIRENVFLATLPQHIELLWELETHMRPAAPGRYSLGKRALQFHKADPHGLIELIEKGLRGAIPEPIKANILGQPSIRVAEGILIEFSSPGELQQLRRQPAFRKYIDEFLSPQRVLVSSKKAKMLFQMLKRRGVYIHSNEEQPEVRMKRTHFQHNPKTMLQPVGKNVPKMEIIEMYLRWQQALDVWYRTPGYPAEQRRITPLSVEKRGEHTYVIAFCQTRRAQRMFRLDRMEVPGTY